MMHDSEKVTYDLVKDVWLDRCNGKRERVESDTLGMGLRHTEVLDLANLMGIRTVPHVAPVIVQITKHGFGHFVVIDERGVIHDPSA